MARSAIADEIERLVAAQLSQDDAIRLHAQTGFHATLGSHVAGALPALEYSRCTILGWVMNNSAHPRMVTRRSLVRDVVDRDFMDSGLAAASGARNDDIFFVVHRFLEETRRSCAGAATPTALIVVAKLLLLLKHLFKKPSSSYCWSVLVCRDGSRMVIDILPHHRLAGSRTVRAGPWGKSTRQPDLRRCCVAGIAFVDHCSTELTGPFEGQGRHFDPLPSCRVSRYSSQVH